MKALGIDIGTTSICAVVLDGVSGDVLETISIDNDASLTGQKTWEALQDTEKIWQKTYQLVYDLRNRHTDIGAIGLTGQMHGIVYIDGDGKAVSPLYTWQDGRGDQIVDPALVHTMSDDISEPDQSDQNKRPVALTYAGLLSRLSGFKLSTGYGAVTHFYNLHNDLTPASTVKLCTIHDYIGMRLTGRKSPLIHSSDAASLGFFQDGRFDETALRQCGIDPGIFPEIAADFAETGQVDNIPVIVAIGDNQASFIGSVRDMAGSIVLNIGTSGQISLLADDQNLYADQDDKKLSATGVDDTDEHFTKMEIRPLCTAKDKAEDLKIAVGATLCGGKAYAVLENLFQSVIEMAGLTAEQEKVNGASLFPVMNELAAQAMKQEKDDSDQLLVSTRFSGTRENPQLRGSIHNINMQNLDAQSLTLGVLSGIIEELHDYYQPSNKHRLLIGSGNALRRNPVLQQLAAKRFDLPLMIPAHKEEAAYGAALAALTGSGFCNSLAQAQSLIRYQEG